jgi:ankyrin repeat protein
VRLLLERGAAVDARSPNGSTALMMAARYGSEEAVAMLLERGADVAARNQLDLGPADFARAVGRESLAKRLESLARR